MLTLTDHAQTAVRTMTQDPQAPEGAGLRITPGNEGLELMLVAEPVPGDALIDDGKVNFFLASPDTMSSPDALDDETQASHDASRAEPLPE